MSLYAVLDTDELASWLGAELPVRTGLLNFFYIQQYGALDAYLEQHVEIDWRDPRLCRVVPADPAHAVEVLAPSPAETFSPPVALHASPIFTLPGREAPDLDRLNLGPDSGYPYPPFMFVHDNFTDVWTTYCQENHAADQAFGHPQVLATAPGEGDVHLLQVASNELWNWSEGGWLHFAIPVDAFLEGDFTQAFTYPDGW